MTDSARPRRANTKPGAPPVMHDARRARPEEFIGGGYFVFRRTGGTGRIRVPEWPFEWQTRALAEREAERLAALHPGETFQVFGQMTGKASELHQDIERDAALIAGTTSLSVAQQAAARLRKLIEALQERGPS